MNMAMNIALNLPEIRQHIGLFLHLHDIQSCRLVNKDWSESFTPALCFSLNFSTSPLPSTFLQNATHIRKLTLSEVTPTTLYTLPGLHHLQDVNFEGKGGWSGRHAWPKFERFIRDCCFSTLTNLRINTADLYDSESLWDIVGASCSNLRTLHVGQDHCHSMTDEAFVALWKAVCQTEVHELSLSLVWELGTHGAHFWPGELQTLKMGEGVTKVQKLRLDRLVGMQGRGLNQLIELCPDLIELDCEELETVETDELAWVLSYHPWRNLTSFRCQRWAAWDRDLAILIRALPKTLTHLDMSFCGQFGTMAFEALRARCPKGNFSSLKELSFRHCLKVTSTMILAILEKSPNLIVFAAEVLETKDLLKGGRPRRRPWACAKTLQQLTLEIKLSRPVRYEQDREAVKEESRAVCEALGTLKELRSLTLRNFRSGISALEVNLGLGLDFLGSLTKLQRVHLEGILGLDLQDLEWVMGHWPRLESGRFPLNRQAKIESGLRDRLRGRGVRLVETH